MKTTSRNHEGFDQVLFAARANFRPLVSEPGRVASVKTKGGIEGQAVWQYENQPRILAVLLLSLIVALALFGKVFRFGSDCSWTAGQPARGQVYDLCDWFTTR